MLSDKPNKSNSFVKRAVLLMGLALSTYAGAHDLGVQGRVWEITEIDIRQLLMESLARADFEAVRKEREKATTDFMDNLPKRQMARTDKTETRWIDPSLEIVNDIQTVGDDPETKELAWNTLHKKGTRVNPLLVQKPLTALLFFDGKSKEQLEFVDKVLREDTHGRIVLLEATGVNVGDLTKMFGRPVFYANDQVVERFNINVAPSLLYAGDGEYEGLLGLTSFASPYQVQALKAVWELDITKTRGPMIGAPNAISR
jgi:hypothetical protein